MLQRCFWTLLKKWKCRYFKSGKEAIKTNIAIVSVFKGVLREAGLSEDTVQILEDTSHEKAAELMKANEYMMYLFLEEVLD